MNALSIFCRQALDWFATNFLCKIWNRYQKCYISVCDHILQKKYHQSNLTAQCENKWRIKNNITDIFWFPLDKVRNIGITKSPNLTNYAEGATSITLECSAEGNPTPNFTWHKDSDMNTTLAIVKTFILSQNDTIFNNTGNYVCVGHNTFNGKQHELTKVQHLQIG